MDENLVKNTPKLGFGLMRLPRISGDEHTIDIEQVKVMVDRFLAAGLTYFDTAYVYEGSEEAAGKALVARHPRDSYTLATKLNASAAKNEEDAKNQIHVSLERTGAGYFDFYLLHALSKQNVGLYDKYGLWDYVRELKEKGLVRHYGFSFHDSPEMLEDLLTKHPDVEFVQLQLNYADWDNPSVQSGRNLEVCQKHGKPVVVMEPVKGGTLANPPESVTEIFRKADHGASDASWAIRFAASQKGILTVLSGMSNTEQMDDNLSYMKNFVPLNAAEEETVKKAQETLAAIDQIPCTGCHYCTPGCPQQIPIPDIFRAMNLLMIYGDRQLENAKRQYGWATAGKGKASDCIQCGQCEYQCPQHIKVIDQLVKCREALED